MKLRKVVMWIDRAIKPLYVAGAVLGVLLALGTASAQTTPPNMPDSIFSCFAQAQFTLSPTGVITPVFWPQACFNSVLGYVPSIDSTYVYNWQTSNWQPNNVVANDNYLASAWNEHCANCFPKYNETSSTYTFVYAAPAPPTPAPPTPTIAPTPGPSPAPSATATPTSMCPPPVTDTVISGWDFGNIAWDWSPWQGAPNSIITGFPGRAGNLPPGINPTALWYAALENGTPMPLYDGATCAPIWNWGGTGSSGWWDIYNTRPPTAGNPNARPPVPASPGQMYLVLKGDPSTGVAGGMGPPPWPGAFPNGPKADTAPWLQPPNWTPVPGGSATPPWTPAPSATWTPAPSGSATPPWTPAPSSSATPAPTATWTAIPSWWSTPICTTGVLDPPWPTSYCEGPTPTPTATPTPLPNMILSCPAGTVMPPGCTQTSKRFSLAPNMILYPGWRR